MSRELYIERYHGPFKEPHETTWQRNNMPKTLFILVPVGHVRQKHARHLFQCFAVLLCVLWRSSHIQKIMLLCSP